MNPSALVAADAFVDATKESGLTEVMWSSTAGFADLDGDGFPDLYVAHYGDWGFDTNHSDQCVLITIISAMSANLEHSKALAALRLSK